MLQYLMNKDTAVVEYDRDEFYIKILDQKKLPYGLQNRLQNTDGLDLKSIFHSMSVLNDWFCSRVLNLSRSNAKVLLNVSSLPQTLKTSDRLKIVDACKGLSVDDNFWIKDDGEKTMFSEVNLRNSTFNKDSYRISALGEYVKTDVSNLRADLGTQGLFPKAWVRNPNGTLELWKTDNMSGMCVNAEYEAYKCLRFLDTPVVTYRLEESDNKLFSVSPCFVTDQVSFCSAQEMKDFYHGDDKKFQAFQSRFDLYHEMTVADYIMANTDRHLENYGYMFQSDEMTIRRQAPLFDLNQAFISDRFGTNIDDLRYEPSGKSFLRSVKESLEFVSEDFLERLSELSLSDRVTDSVKNRIHILTKDFDPQIERTISF